MASVKKITMREYNGTDYDTLYPKTIASQVDGVYNKTEVDTLLANKAPAGYVQGVYNISNGDSLDAILDTVYGNMPNNFAQVVEIADNVGVAWGGGNYFAVIKRTSAEYGVVDFVSHVNNGTALRKARVNGVWCPLEWVNPPMALGKEYRTTERWKGKPVYAIAFVFGELPNASTKIKYAPAAKNVDEIIACGGCGADYSLPNLYPVSSYNSFSIYDIKLAAALSSNGGIACIIGTGMDFSSQKATVWVKYTKTTD